MPASAEVVIAGGGPAGLAAALELGNRGIHVVVLEPRHEVSTQRPRAKTTSARTMEHLRRWGLADRVRQVAPLPVAWSQDAAFVTALLGEEITRFTNCFGMTPVRIDDAAESGQQIAQPLLESVFREAVAAMPTITLATGWAMTGLDENGDHVVVSAERSDRLGPPDERAPSADGAMTQQITAEYVLGCDGSRSRTRIAIGAQYEGNTDARYNFNVVFRAPGLLKLIHLAPAIHYWILDSDVPGLVGPLDLDDTWWSMIMGVDEETGNADPERLVRRLIGPGTDELDIDIVGTDPWIGRMMLADSYGGGRVYLVGDSAHLNPPWGGHGFNTALGDAANIGWKLAAVIRGWAGPNILASYETERRPIAKQTIDEATANMRTLSAELAHRALSEPGPSGEAARATAAEQIQATKDAEFHSAGLVLGYRYDESPVICAEDAPIPAFDPGRYTPSTRPGGRLPHLWLPDGRSLFDLLGAGMTLLVLVPSGDATPFVKAADNLGIPLGVLDATGLQIPGCGTESLVLVRPDQHVVWRGGESSLSTDDAELVLRHGLALQPFQRE